MRSQWATDRMFGAMRWACPEATSAAVGTDAGWTKAVRPLPSAGGEDGRGAEGRSVAGVGLVSWCGPPLVLQQGQDSSTRLACLRPVWGAGGFGTTRARQACRAAKTPCSRKLDRRATLVYSELPFYGDPARLARAMALIDRYNARAPSGMKVRFRSLYRLAAR
jgi:hypothetical protein